MVNFNIVRKRKIQLASI